MVDAIAFQARARTIDHLGREQIADCPTAITELWKNAFDAYARSVHLHIMDGDISTAALVDDGHGMSKSELLNKWLVLGTESKAAGAAVPDADRNGLSIRQRQGQKGIGRLSAAALGPLMLLISKRVETPYVAALIDWRLFENPFLYLNDIKIPIVEFEKKEELLPLLDQMFDRLMGNVWGDVADKDRSIRLADAWRMFDTLEHQQEKASTRVAIEQVLLKASITDRQLDLWPVWTGEANHGTAMIVADVAFDLRAQLPSLLEASEEAVAAAASSRLINTLNNFVDPYIGEFSQPNVPNLPPSIGHTQSSQPVDFSYGATVWEGALNKVLVTDTRAFSLINLESLEHIVDGWVDATGVFRGRIKAFGKWLDDAVVIGPESPLKLRADSRVGTFHLRLGTFEQELRSTTHEAAIHANLTQIVKESAGFFVFRDGLRVLPYGREDNDFFEIERRRGLHAGREYWSIRRLFGRVAIGMSENPNLKDKAGREGFIDNKAAKIFRDLVENVLQVTARRFFGTDSAIRKNTVPKLNENFGRQRAEEAQKKLSTLRRKNFRKNLALFLPEAISIRDELDGLAALGRTNNFPSSEQGLLSLRTTVEELRDRQSQLTLGVTPTNLGTLEKDFKGFRRAMNQSSELIVQLRDSISVAIDRIKPRSSNEIAHAELNRNAAYLHSRIRKWGNESRQLLSAEAQRLTELIERRNKLYHAVTLPMLSELDQGSITLSDTLRKLDREKESQDQESERIFNSYISTLQSMAEDIDLEGLVSFALDENAAHRQEIQRLNALAQLGITVEIVSHEVAGLEGAISSGLHRLPEEVKGTDAYLTIKHSHESLSDRLRFLAPLKLSGERSSEWLMGSDIADFVGNFLRDSLESGNIELTCTKEFLNFKVFDQFARILPVFINLVNNSIYWTKRTDNEKNIILLDAADDRVFICDNGPGVENEDIPSLFSLFFTRKLRGGRGVGLYLCRANLAAAGHSIEYIKEKEFQRLSGANFSIKFSGAKYV